jgi:4-alpha-glucanotransferase
LCRATREGIGLKRPAASGEAQQLAHSRLSGKLRRVDEGELRLRAAELGVSVSYWDWLGHEVIVGAETLQAIVTALEEVPLADAHAPTPLEAVAPVPSERSWGFTVQLYSLRSAGSWGHGDLRDLADFAAWSARDLGAGFVLINPLHAAEPLPPVSPSPYLPMSRRWVSPLYLRIEDIAEYKDLDDEERTRLTVLSAPLLAASRTPALIDRDAVWTAKREALEVLRKVPLTDVRQASLDAFRLRHGQALEDWGAWCALAEVHGPDYRTWPARLRDPRTAEAEVRRGDLAALAEFHAWVQWLVAEQVSAAQAAARDAGMAIGIIADLAIGAHPGGADAWAGQEFLASGFTVGAPPDAFNQRGQDWALPPYHPRALAAAGYRPLAELFDSTLGRPPGGAGGDGAAGRYGHEGDGIRGGGAGGLRIDHVMGLSRLWWIPAGMSPAEGAYVYYNAQGTLGTLASGAAADGGGGGGEDLGTVEPWLREALAARGALGTQLLWFERGWANEPLAPQWWRRNSLVTVSTHDLPPAVAFLSGSQVTDRLALGLLTRSEAEERAEASQMVDDWIGALVEKGLLPRGERPDADAFTAALYGYLALTPARLIGVNLAEAAGESRSQNMPGTSTEYPNWLLPLCGPSGEPVLLEDMAAIPRIRTVANAVAGGVIANPAARAARR